MKKSRSLCEKRFTSLVLTASFAMAIEYLMLLSDSIIIGNMLGEKALAGLNIVTPLFSIVVFVGTVISVGTTVCYSFEMGKLDKDAADRYFGQGIIMAVSAGIILFMTVFLIKTSSWDITILHRRYIPMRSSTTDALCSWHW